MTSHVPQFYWMRSRRRVGDLSLETPAILAPISIGFNLMFPSSSVRGCLDGPKVAWYDKGGSIVTSYVALGTGRLLLR